MCKSGQCKIYATCTEKLLDECLYAKKNITKNNLIVKKKNPSLISYEINLFISVEAERCKQIFYKRSLNAFFFFALSKRFETLACMIDVWVWMA